MNGARSFFSVCAGLLGLALLLPRPATAAWPTDPQVNVPLCTIPGYQGHPTITSDGAGGAIVTWEDRRSGNSDIYAQRISADGTVQWTANGVALCTAAGDQRDPTIIADGAGGAIVTWWDGDIHAQRISAGGTPQWTANGVALCTADYSQGPPTITSDGAGGAIATWEDHRYGSENYGIFAQRVQANGQLGGDVVSVLAEVPLAFALDPVRPNPSRGRALTVHFTLASETPASLELLDVAGRRVAAREVGSLGVGHHALDLGEGQPVAPGLYLVRLTQGAYTRTTRVAVLR